MAGILPVRTVGQQRPFDSRGRAQGRPFDGWSDAQDSAQGRRCGSGEGSEHDASRFAGRDHVDVTRTLERGHDVAVVERSPYETAGINAVNGSADDRCKVLADRVVELCQLGSVS
jgi:hypothetical protein